MSPLEGVGCAEESGAVRCKYGMSMRASARVRAVEIEPPPRCTRTK